MLNLNVGTYSLEIGYITKRGNKETQLIKFNRYEEEKK